MGKGYTVTKIYISSGNYRMKLLILRPTVNQQHREKTPGVLWIHGGRYAVGMAEMVFMSRAKRLVTEYGAVVISPEYRLAGKAPYPAALEDCYKALQYLKEHAAELGCASDQIMVGESAGGGLTVALCMLARDRGEVSIAFQMPLYPMLDHRDTDSSRNNHGISWNTKRNHAAWKLYLREVDDEIPAYVDVYPTGFHAFDMLLPFRKISRRLLHLKDSICMLQNTIVLRSAIEHHAYNKKCVGREGHIRKVPIDEFEIAL